MEDRKFWMLLCLITLLTLSLSMPAVVMAQDLEEEEEEGGQEESLRDQDTSNWFKVEGYSASNNRNTAIQEGYRSAMIEFLQDNLSSSQYEANESKLKAFIKSNWKKFTLGEAKSVKPKRGEEGSYTMKVRVREEKLLKEVRQLFFTSPEILKGMEAVLMSDTNTIAEANADEWKDRDAMFDTVHAGLQPFMSIVNLKALDQKMEMEAKALGRSAWASPADYFQEQLDKVRLQIYLWVTTKKFADPMTRSEQYIATVRSRGVWRQTGEELWHFAITSGDETKTWKTSPVSCDVIGEREARIRAIKNVSDAVTKKIDFHVRASTEILDVYLLRFVNFNPEQREKVERSLNKLTNRKNPPLKVLRGGRSSGSYWELRVKWLRAGELDKVRAVVTEECANNEVYVDANRWSTGIIWFQPGKAMEEG